MVVSLYRPLSTYYGSNSVLLTGDLVVLFYLHSKHKELNADDLLTVGDFSAARS